MTISSYDIIGDLHGHSRSLEALLAKPGGKLVAYRWDGEQTLCRDKFKWVHRIET